MVRKIIYVVAALSWFMNSSYMALNKWTFTELLFIISVTLFTAVLAAGLYTIQCYQFEVTGYANIVRLVAGNVYKMLRMTLNNLFPAFIGCAACVGLMMLGIFMFGYRTDALSVAIFFLCMLGGGIGSIYVSQKEMEK